MQTHIEKYQFDWESSQLPVDVQQSYNSYRPSLNQTNARNDIVSGLNSRPRHLQIDDRQFTLKAPLSL